MGKSKDAFRTISEVAEWLDTQAHVLRFWESKFSQVKPVKRAGGRRYYRPADMMLLGGIKKLLHDDGMTIKGAQKLLREKGVKHVSALSQPLEEELTDELRSKPVKKATETVETAAVLEFAKPTTPEPLTDEDLSDMAESPMGIDENTLIKQVVDEPVEIEEEIIPPTEEVPAFVQRSIQSKSDETKADLPAEDTPTKEDIASDVLDAETVTEDTVADNTVAEDTVTDAELVPPAKPVVDKTTAPNAEDVPKKETVELSMEPESSLLPQLSRTIGIAKENRAPAKDLIQKLQALCTRIADHENA